MAGPEANGDVPVPQPRRFIGKAVHTSMLLFVPFVYFFAPSHRSNNDTQLSYMISESLTCNALGCGAGKRAAQERAAQLASGGGLTAGSAAPSERVDASGADSGGQMVTAAQTGPKRFVRQQVPDEVLHDAALNQAIAVLPLNYNFEVRHPDCKM